MTIKTYAGIITLAEAGAITVVPVNQNQHLYNQSEEAYLGDLVFAKAEDYDTVPGHYIASLIDANGNVPGTFDGVVITNQGYVPGIIADNIELAIQASGATLELQFFARAAETGMPTPTAYLAGNIPLFIQVIKA